MQTLRPIAWTALRPWPPPWLLRHSRWDALLVALALLHGALLLEWPSIPLIALGLWWNANTISHNFIHRPFFRPRAVNVLFSAYLSLLLGIPQTLWRDRHLAHHAQSAWQLRWSRRLAAESVLVAALWGALLVWSPWFVVTVYLPGFLLGLGLCELQGRFEHTRGVISHYGGLYNLLFFNDGYHAEHHARPADHWTQLPQRRRPEANSSRWPAVLRWFETFSLDWLECLVLRSRWLQEFVVRRHERAFRALLPPLPGAPRIGIVGGGLFPRTALVLQRVRPDARLIILDANADHLKRAREFLGRSLPTASWGHEPGRLLSRSSGTLSSAPSGGVGWGEEAQFMGSHVEFIHRFFEPSRDRAWVEGLDLLILPLAYSGDRAAIYHQPPAPRVLVHDWLWHSQGTSAVVSCFLLKRLNLLQR